MRLNAHFGELPSGAFQHCGDRKIKLQGGGGGFIDDIVDTVVDPVKDFGSDVVKAGESFIEDPVEFTGNLIEYAGDNPVETALMVAAAIYAPDMTAAWLAETGATAEAAVAAEAAAASAEAAAVAEGMTAAEAAIAAQTAYDAAITANAAAAAEAFNMAQINAGIAEGAGAGSFGISAQPSTGAFGTFNPSTTSGIGLQAPELSGLGSLGGTAAMEVGTAGLTAEQLAQATANAQVGSNAASGLGYLGGAESLPSGTAGVTGVTTPVTITPKDAQQALKLGQQLFGGQQQQPQSGIYQQQIRPQGVVDYSPTLSLLQQRVKTPNVYSLLG